MLYGQHFIIYVDGSVFTKLAGIVHGHYHMWFIFMIVGIYICLPFIKAITDNENRTRYYLLLAIVFTFIIPEIQTLINDFGSERLMKAMRSFDSSISNMWMHMVMGYVGYFVLGYYLNKIDLNKKKRIVVYIVGVLGFAATIGLDLIVALQTQTYCYNYYGDFNLNVLFEAVALFVWLKYCGLNNATLNKLIQKLSKYSFGAYLIHALIVEELNNLFGLNTLSFNSALAVPCIGVIVFIVSYGISALLNQIPVVNKYIV